MSMLKKLKGIFVVDDGTTPPPPPAAPASKAKAAATKKSTASPTSKPTAKSSPSVKSSGSPSIGSKPNKSSAPVSGKPEPKFVNVLLKAIEANNEEGFDYLEYKQSLQNLSTMDMDTQTKYKSALAMAKTMGVTSSKLIASAKRYVRVLEAEEGKFNQALANQKAKQVQGRQDKIQAYEKAIIDNETQIQKLQKEIEKHKSALDKVKLEINAASNKVEATHQNFGVAYQSVKNQIVSDIQNMEKYLK